MPIFHQALKGMLVAGACAIAISFFNPITGVVPVVLLQEMLVPLRKVDPDVQKINGLIAKLGTLKGRKEVADEILNFRQRAIDPLIVALGKNPNPKIREGSAYILGRLESHYGLERTVEPLFRAFSKDNAKGLNGTVSSVADDSLHSLLRKSFPAFIEMMDDRKKSIPDRIGMAKYLADLSDSLPPDQQKVFDTSLTHLREHVEKVGLPTEAQRKGYLKDLDKLEKVFEKKTTNLPFPAPIR